MRSQAIGQGGEHVTSTPQQWVFAPLATMSHEQRQRWLETCFTKTNVDELFTDPSRSVIAITQSGCGVTTSLSRLSAYELLGFQYNPDQWPGQIHAFTNAADHFAQWMAHTAYQITEAFKQQPERLEQLTSANHEFLIWLLRHYLGRRQSDTWLQSLQSHIDADSWQSLNDKTQKQQLDDLYGTTISDLYGQIEECLQIARKLGWKGIYACIDINWIDWISRTLDERERLMAGIKQILMRLSPLQRPGFGIKMGLHENVLSIQAARDLVRGRAVVVTYDWSINALMRLADQLITLATDGQANEQQVLPAMVWDMLSGDIKAIWGALGPAAAVALAQHALAARSESDTQRGYTVKQALYRHSALLHLDHDPAQRQIWRGMQAIPLDDAQFRVFEVLWRHRGEPVSNQVLMNIAGSKSNLDQIISRIRGAIEPFGKAQKSYTYVQRTITSGTWLEKTTCRFG
jgi:hypothetical protein